MIRFYRYLLCLPLILFIMGNVPVVTDAQAEPPTVYFCVDPTDEEQTPYLIEFWDSEVFGILIPQDAVVTIYTSEFYTANLYTVNTNARTGGYLPLELLAETNTFTQIPADNPCLNNDTRALFDGLPVHTIPMPISENHAIVVQQGDNSELSNPFQRVISFTFGIGEEDGELRNLQIIQNSELDTFLNFRILDIAPNTPFMVVANKDFGIGQSLPDTDPPEFSRERPSDIRSFVQSDLQDLYGLDIFEIADASSARVYISSGLLDIYRGTYIRISLAPDTAERIPPFTEGTLIQALPSATAAFVSLEQIDDNPLRIDLPFDDNPQGQLTGDSVYRVIEIEELTGQLVIDFDGNPAIIESWLTIPTTPETE